MPALQQPLTLRTSDGTPEGTRLVKDLYPGKKGSKPRHFTPAGDRVYFAAGIDESPNLQYWVSDGTEAGTVLLLESGSPCSAWKYLPRLAEASDPPDAWRSPDFDDSAWPAGAAPFGYGDPPHGTDLGRLIPPMQRNYTCLFLRREFHVPRAEAVVDLYLQADYTTTASRSGSTEPKPSE